MVSQNSINNTVSDNTFSVNRSLAATSVIAAVNQTDNSNTSSNSYILAETGGTAGGDPFLRLSVSGGQDYSFGIDNSVTDDPLKITDDANPSTGNLLWNMDAIGARTMPLQVATSARLLTNDDNVTGNSSDYTIGTNTSLSELFDQNDNFTAGGVGGAFLTAPVSGIYYYGYDQQINNNNTSSNSFTELVTSNNTFRLDASNPTPQRNTNGNGWGLTTSAIVEMDAADTAKSVINVTNSGGKIVDLASETAGGLYRNGITTYFIG